MNKEIKDQTWHFLSNFALTLLVFIPFVNAVVVILWAFTREYYQHKNHALTFWENIPEFNTDLFFSCIGVVVGIVASTLVWVWILL